MTARFLRMSFVRAETPSLRRHLPMLVAERKQKLVLVGSVNTRIGLVASARQHPTLSLWLPILTGGCINDCGLPLEGLALQRTADTLRGLTGLESGWLFENQRFELGALGEGGGLGGPGLGPISSWSQSFVLVWRWVTSLPLSGPWGNQGGLCCSRLTCWTWTSPLGGGPGCLLSRNGGRTTPLFRG